MTPSDTSYLIPAVNAFYPDNAQEFRDIYQIPNHRAPEGRQEGLRRMTDHEVVSLATSLRLAALHRPSEIDRLWALVCAKGLAVRA